MSNVASLHILPGVEYNDMPAPTLPVLPPVTEVPTTNEVPRLLDWRRSRVRNKLIDTEVEYIDDTRHDTVIRAMALGAQLKRGFSMKGYKYPDGTTGATVEPKHVQPQNLRESLTSNWRQGQVLRRDHRHHESERIKEKYTKKPSAKDFLPDDYDSLPRIKQRAAMNEAKKKVRLHPGEFTLGTSEHLQQLRGLEDADGRVIIPRAEMPAAARRSQEKHITKYRRDHDRSHGLQHSLDKGANGTTLAGKIRQRKIRTGEQKIYRLQRKSDNYDRLAYLRDIRKAKTDVINSEQRASGALTEQQEHSAKPRPSSKFRGRRYDSRSSKLQTRVTKTQNDIIENVPKFDASKTEGRVNPADVPLEAPGIRNIQEKFGEKWAHDIDIQLVRTQSGRQVMHDKGPDYIKDTYGQ